MITTTLTVLLLAFIFLNFSLLRPAQQTTGEIKFRCALSLVSQLEESRDKADALVEIARLSQGAGDREFADRLLSEALIWTGEIEHGLSKAAVIGAISEIGSADHVERAAELAKSIGGSHRSWASRRLMIAYDRLGMTDKAVALLREAAAATASEKTKHETWYGDRDHELTQVLADAARAGLTDEALKIGRSIKHKYVKGDVLSAAAVKLVEQKQYRRAINEARSIYYEVERIHALVEVANGAAKAGSNSAASEALSYALTDTENYDFDPEQDTKTKALVAIAQSYENTGQREKALVVLERAAKVADTIEKPGFRDSGLSQVALAYARLRMFDKALELRANIPGRAWSHIEPHTLAGIAEQMIDAGDHERALSTLAKAFEHVRDMDCTYFKYATSARSCFGDKTKAFIEVASIFQKAGSSEKAIEMLDLAVMQNKYKSEPPHAVIEEEASRLISLSSAPEGEQEIVKGYLAEGEFQKAIEVASRIKDAKDRVVAVATIEFKLSGGKEKQSLAAVGC